MSDPHVEVTPELIERYFSLTASAREKATPLHNPESAEGMRLSTMMEMADSLHFRCQVVRREWRFGSCLRSHQLRARMD